MDKKYWDLLSPQNKLALFFHETIYKEMRNNGEKTSQRVRKIVAKLVSDEIFPSQTLIAGLSPVGKPSHETIYCKTTFEREAGETRQYKPLYGFYIVNLQDVDPSLFGAINNPEIEIWQNAGIQIKTLLVFQIINDSYTQVLTTLASSRSMAQWMGEDKTNASSREMRATSSLLGGMKLSSKIIDKGIVMGIENSETKRIENLAPVDCERL